MIVWCGLVAEAAIIVALPFKGVGRYVNPEDANDCFRGDADCAQNGSAAAQTRIYPERVRTAA